MNHDVDMQSAGLAAEKLSGLKLIRFCECRLDSKTTRFDVHALAYVTFRLFLRDRKDNHVSKNADREGDAECGKRYLRQAPGIIVNEDRREVRE